MVEYNQCQGSLKELYELGISGSADEFTAYRILMLLHGMNRTGMSSFPVAACMQTNFFSRFKPSRRSTDSFTETTKGHQTCFRSATRDVYQQLSCFL